MSLARRVPAQVTKIEGTRAFERLAEGLAEPANVLSTGR